MGVAGGGDEQGFLLKEDEEGRPTLGRAVLVESRKTNIYWRTWKRMVFPYHLVVIRSWK